MAEIREQRKQKPSCTERPFPQKVGTEVLNNKKKGKMRVSLPDRPYRPEHSPKKIFSCRKVSVSAVRSGSLTVEAAWAVPLFFLGVLSLIFMMELYGTYAEKTVRLQEQAETAAAYASLAGGAAPPVIELWDRFTYRPRWYPDALPGVSLAVRGRVKPWTGRTAEESAQVQGETEEMVYVTDYESVYHTSSSCTHLALTVQAVSGSAAGRKRNVYGKRYHACDKCVGSGGKNTVVYITNEGDCYHNSAECSGLKRTTHLVRRSEAEGLPLCSRCSQMEAA